MPRPVSATAMTMTPVPGSVWPEIVMEPPASTSGIALLTRLYKALYSRRSSARMGGKPSRPFVWSASPFSSANTRRVFSTLSTTLAIRQGANRSGTLSPVTQSAISFIRSWMRCEVSSSKPSTSLQREWLAFALLCSVAGSRPNSSFSSSCRSAVAVTPGWSKFGCRELAITYHLRQLIRKGEGPETEGKRTRRDEPWQPKLPDALGLGLGQPDEGKPDPTDKTRHASQKDCPVVLFGNGVELFEHAHAQEAQGEEREFSAAGLLL